MGSWSTWLGTKSVGSLWRHALHLRKHNLFDLRQFVSAEQPNGPTTKIQDQARIYSLDRRIAKRGRGTDITRLQTGSVQLFHNRLAENIYLFKRCNIFEVSFNKLYIIIYAFFKSQISIFALHTDLAMSQDYLRYQRPPSAFSIFWLSIIS